LFRSPFCFSRYITSVCSHAPHIAYNIMNKKILGWDISSTTTAYCLLEIDDITKEIKLASAGYIKPIKNGNIIERVADARDKIKTIIENVKPDYIGIEEIISFMKGKSTAKTIITLTTFNRMIGLLSYDYLQRSPELFNIMSIRHGLKFDKKLPKKEDMPEIVAKHLNINFKYEYNTKGKIKIENEDLADAMAVALYYAFILIGKITPKNKGKKKNEPKTSVSKIRNTRRIDKRSSQSSIQEIGGEISS
jgi:Holliday junction resolvasome RuvABC endonuclease subunit